MEWPEKAARIFPQGERVLIVHASHTGNAESIAKDLLKSNPAICELVAMSELTPATLEQYGRHVYVVATHGEGTPPTAAMPFFHALTTARINLSQIEFSVLALGSRSYKHFCRFGHDLYAVLVTAGAVPRTLTVEVHNNNNAMIAHWRKKLTETFGLHVHAEAEWETATVMAVTQVDAGASEVTLYIQCLELETPLRLQVREASQRQDVVAFEVVPDKGGRFTRIRVEGTTKVARALAIARPGDKWLVKSVMHRQ